MTTVAGLVILAAATAAGSPASRAQTTRWPGRLAFAMQVAAVSAAMPSLSRRATIAVRWRMPMRMTRFVPDRLSADQSIRLAGSSGSRCPDTTLKPAAPSVLVSGTPARAGAAVALATPGTTSTGIPASAQDFTSWAPCANTNGSPPLSRTTVLPARARSTMVAMISS